MATITLTPTVEAGALPPRVRLDVTASGTPTVSAVTITRLDPDGHARKVRTPDDGPLVLAGGSATVYDYEPPYGSAVTYATDQAGGPTVTLTVNAPDIWLIHPGVPSRSVKLPVVTDMGSVVRPVEQGVFRVLTRPDPVIVTAGGRSTPAGTLGVRTKTDAERQALDLVLDDGVPLLLNVPASYGWGVGATYLAVGEIRRSRTVDWAGHPWREWELPYQVVSRPAGGTQAAIIWNDLATRGANDYTAAAGSKYATWQAIIDAGVTSWAELAAPTG